MPRVVVTSENGAPTWVERVMPEDFATEHFRRCLCERLRWAVADAEAATPAARPVATPHSVSAGARLNRHECGVALAA